MILVRALVAPMLGLVGVMNCALVMVTVVLMYVSIVGLTSCVEVLQMPLLILLLPQQMPILILLPLQMPLLILLLPLQMPLLILLLPLQMLLFNQRPHQHPHQLWVMMDSAA